MTTSLDTLSDMKEERLSIRTSAEVKRELEAAARFHGRTVSNYLIWIERRYRKQAQLNQMYDNLEHREQPKAN